jgi:hypothetical protein
VPLAPETCGRVMVYQYMDIWMHSLVFYSPYENAWSKLQKKKSVVYTVTPDDEQINATCRGY